MNHPLDRLSPRSLPSKRTLLKAIGSGAVLVPWSRPVVESVVLPTHAITSDLPTHDAITSDLPTDDAITPGITLLSACVDDSDVDDGEWNIEGYVVMPPECCTDIDAVDIELRIEGVPVSVPDLECFISPDSSSGLVISCDDSNDDVTNVFALSNSGFTQGQAPEGFVPGAEVTVIWKLPGVCGDISRQVTVTDGCRGFEEIVSC